VRSCRVEDSKHKEKQPDRSANESWARSLLKSSGPSEDRTERRNTMAGGTGLTPSLMKPSRAPRLAGRRTWPQTEKLEAVENQKRAGDPAGSPSRNQKPGLVTCCGNKKAGGQIRDREKTKQRQGTASNQVKTKKTLLR
jgi:hypothetical protein